MQVELISGEAVFEILAEEWDALAKMGMTDTPFQKLVYQRSWWKNVRPADGQLNTVAVRNSDGELNAVACLYVTDDGKVRFNGCVEETDYLDIITTAHDAQENWQAIMAFMLSDEFPTWHHLELCNVPAASLTRQVLPEVAGEHGLTVIESVNEVCPVIMLPDNFETYLESLESKQRREISRKLRRANGADGELHIVSQEDELESEVNDFLTLLQKSTFEKRDWLNDGRRALFQETAAAAQQDGTLQLIFLKFDGQKAAALFNFDYAGRIWVYNSGLDPDLFAALSPGVVITAKAIELAIDEGREEFDFLRGDEEYKYRFGAMDTSVFRLQIVR
jgi:CelD/BcsL family acetyltransferase involved in cellulose biosynthesis